MNSKYEIDLTKDFLKQVKKLDYSIQKMVFKKIELLKSNPYKGKPLQNILKNYRSLRVKSFRIIYRVVEDEKIIKILKIGHKNHVY
ncbi:MAG: type II toxin-antitoxin system RelE/ParE family toxin [Methanosarcinales archaeon]